MNYESRKWSILFRSKSALDGERQSLIHGDDGLPRLFKTKREAKAFADLCFGYIRKRPDLRREPHGWRMPRPVRVTIEVYPTPAQGE